jgi:hypothetical protein
MSSGVKLGLLMDDGKIKRTGSITDTIEKFVLMRRSEWVDLPGFRPVRIMRRIEDEWVPLDPTDEQIKKCLSMLATLAVYLDSDYLRPF